ncbi:MAG: hypothetical protein Pyrs2KO_26670 [Pyruvatibacter sp.]
MVLKARFVSATAWRALALLIRLAGFTMLAAGIAGAAAWSADHPNASLFLSLLGWGLGLILLFVGWVVQSKAEALRSRIT